MDELRQITSQALALRKSKRLRVRLPLAKLKVVTSRKKALKPFAGILAEELNVKKVKLGKLKDDSAEKYGIVQTLSLIHI